MGEPFIGSEALREGRLTRHTLRTRFVAVYPGVYLAAEAEPTAVSKAKAGALWTGRDGIVAGCSAAALHGSRWVSAKAPAEVLWDNRRAPRGLRVWSDVVADDEVQTIGGIRVTTPERTALDIARRYPRKRAVAAIDALARATRMKDRGCRTARRALQGSTRDCASARNSEPRRPGSGIATGDLPPTAGRRP